MPTLSARYEHARSHTCAKWCDRPVHRRNTADAYCALRRGGRLPRTKYLSPRVRAAAYWPRRLPATGCDGSQLRYMASDRRLEGGSRVGRPGPGGPVSPASGKASAMAWSRWPPARAEGLRLRKGRRAGLKCGPGKKSPHAGAGRQPPDREVLRAREGSLGGPEKPPGPMRPPVAEYGTRVPSLFCC